MFNFRQKRDIGEPFGYAAATNLDRSSNHDEPCRQDPADICGVVVLAAFLGLAPFFPEPHLLGKLKLLMAGTLKKPIDIFDLFWHSWPFALLLLKLYRVNMV